MYPSSLPLSEIQSVVSIIRTGEVVSRKAALAHDLWILQGYAQSKIIGNPETNISAQSADDAFFILEKLADEQPVAQASIDWTVILQWAIQMLLDMYLKGKLEVR